MTRECVVSVRCEPIVRLSSGGLRLVAVEVLAGGAVAHHHAAAGLLLEMDTAVAETSLHLALPTDIAIHLNLPCLGDGRTLGSTPYIEALRALVSTRPLVLEISEHTTAAGFMEAFQIAATTGADLVVDDLAPGNKGWQWLQRDILDSGLFRALPRGGGRARRLLPFGGKLDWSYFQSCTGDATRWSDFCDHLQDLDDLLTSLTVEGVERAEHLQMLRGLVRPGLAFDIQGYFINDLFQDLHAAPSSAEAHAI